MGDGTNCNVGSGSPQLGQLPPGFRFYPTDEELVVHFLHRKASLLPCYPDVIPDLELHPYDPWQLRGKALEEENQWYFFSRKQSQRRCRRTNNGYWKKSHQADHPEKPIISKNRLIGIKRHYTFYMGEPPSGVKTSWFMDEYSLSSDRPSSSSASASSSSRKGHAKMYYSNWAVSRVYEHQQSDDENGKAASRIELSCIDEVFLSIEDEYDDISYPS